MGHFGDSEIDFVREYRHTVNKKTLPIRHCERILTSKAELIYARSNPEHTHAPSLQA